MSLTVPVAAVLGLVTALGLLLVRVGLTGEGPHAVDRLTANWRSRFVAGRRPGDARRVAACLAAGAVVATVTRWPVAAALTAVGAWVLPAVIGPDRDHSWRVARTEAIATWTEALRDNLAGAAGLEQAITASAIDAPEPVRDEVTRLAARLKHGWRLPAALRELAADLADPTADLVVAGLLMAARGNAGQLGDVLGELASSARATVASRQRVAAGRKRTRTSARMIVAVTLAMAAMLTLADRPYLRPFDTTTGQLVLLAVGGCFGFAFWWLARLMRGPEQVRILATVAANPGNRVQVDSVRGSGPVPS